MDELLAKHKVESKELQGKQFEFLLKFKFGLGGRPKIFSMASLTENTPENKPRIQSTQIYGYF